MQLNSKFRSLSGLILLVVLMLPSAFFLLRVSPLWRDSDGFYQLSDKPNLLQILHWPPLYCFLARIPLLIGDLAAPVFGKPASPMSFDNPAFTSTGLLFLVFSQHVFLVASLLVAVWKLCCTTVTRLAFALLLVSQPWLYAFAPLAKFRTPPRISLLSCSFWHLRLRMAEPLVLPSLGPGQSACSG
jgi:hypothetical protein